MTQIAQEHRLEETLLFLLVVKLGVHDLLGDEVDLVFIRRRVPMSDKERCAKVTPADALELLELLGVGERRKAVRRIIAVHLNEL